MSKYALEIINANKEALEQGITLLTKLSDQQYTKICSPWFKSTIGQHIRHVADMYFALMESEDFTCVDYDKRNRGSQVEVICAKGIDGLRQIILWLDSLNVEEVKKQELHIKSEVSLHQSTSVTLASSFMRELVFVGSHTVHHYALIGVIAKCQGLQIEEWFGIAPATASFLRKDAVCAQ